MGGKKKKEAEDCSAEEVETQEEIETVEEAVEPTEEEDDSGRPIIVIPSMLGMDAASQKPEVRVIGLIGDVEEEKASEVIYGFLALKESGRKPVDPEDPSKGVYCEPIKLICSTCRQVFFFLQPVQRVRGRLVSIVE